MVKQAIPFIDLRGKTPVDLLRSYPDKARALIRSARRSWGLPSLLASRVALPLADRISADWLARTRNPYLYEIESFADILGVRGVYTLNVSYEWGCTTGVWRTGDSVSLLRALDWPFPAIGAHAMVVLQAGKAGEFYNVTWPGLSGVVNAMAPMRFSAALNQAPMRRHGRGYLGDWIKNRRLFKTENALPPSHLLRQAFEKAANYEAAKEMLVSTPIAIPAIFVLAGLEPGEGCVIERLENDAEVIELSAGQQVSVANHFTGRLGETGCGWRPREVDSHGRLKYSLSILERDLEQEHFNWLQAPVINVNTRLCMVSDAATGRLMVQGFEGVTQVTELFSLPAMMHASRQAI